MSLAEIAHLASSANLPVVMAVSIYYGTRTLAVLTAIYGPEKLSKRALEVLRALRAKQADP
jgi:hypothetical protein